MPPGESWKMWHPQDRKGAINYAEKFMFLLFNLSVKALQASLICIWLIIFINKSLPLGSLQTTILIQLHSKNLVLKWRYENWTPFTCQILTDLEAWRKKESLNILAKFKYVAFWKLQADRIRMGNFFPDSLSYKLHVNDKDPQRSKISGSFEGFFDKC